jgi:DNA-directed RNA polymerase specialized sigma24 family protein
MPDDQDKPCLSETELSRFSDEQLLAYIVEQRESGRPQCAKQALAVLAFGHWDRVYYWVAAKVPAGDVEDVTAVVIESALGSAFDGRSIGRFIAWLKVIAQRRIADYHRGAERVPGLEPLADEHEGEEEVFGEQPAEGSQEEAILTREAVGRVLEDRSEVHQTVVRLYGPNELGFMGLSARETAERTEELHPGSNMSEANVHQIWRRFRSDVAEAPGMGS